VIDAHAPAARSGASASGLPAELERRLADIEADVDSRQGFDGRSWLWLLLLGVLVPAAALVLGWWA
jgi:hypothetical protein